MSTASRVVKNTAFLYIKMVITILVSLISTRLILQSLGASDFGIFTIVGGAIGMLNFLNYTMANATQRFMSYSEGEGCDGKKIAVFNMSMILHILIALLTALVFAIAFFPLFNGILNIEASRLFAAKVVYSCLVVSSLFTIVNVPYDAIMNAHENMLYYSIVGVIESFLKLGVAIACVYASCDKLILYGVLMACIPILTLSVMKGYCHKHYSECRYAFRSSFDTTLIKEIALYSGWNFLTAISNLLSGQGIGIVLNHFFGTALNAAHGIAQQVNAQLCAFAQNMRKALNPVIVKSAGAKDVRTMNYAAQMGCKYSTLLTAFFAVPLILEMPYVLELWLKSVPDWAILFCRLQLLQSLITQSAGSLETSIYAEGRIKKYAIWKSLMNVLPIFITYLSFRMGGGPFWLYVPMIIIWGVGGDLVILHFAKANCSQPVLGWVKIVLLPLIEVILPMFAVGFLVIFLVPSSFIRLIVCCLMTSITMLACMWLFGLGEQEKNSIGMFLTKKNKTIYAESKCDNSRI